MTLLMRIDQNRRMGLATLVATLFKNEKTAFPDGATNGKIIRIRSEVMIVENKGKGTCLHT